VLAVGALAVWSAAGSYRQAFDDRLTGTSHALATAVGTEVATYVLALSTLATAPALDRGGDLEAFQQRAQQVAALLQTHVVLVAPDLSFLVHTHFSTGAGLPDRPPTESLDVVRQVFATGRPAVGDLVRGQVTGQWIAPIYVPVVRGGQVIGAMGAALEAARISQMLAGQSFREGGYASLVDAKGRIVARSSEADLVVGRMVRDWVTEGLSGGEYGILRGRNRSDIEVLTAFRRVPGAPGWFVTFAEPLSTYYASLWSPLATLAIGGLGALGIALVAAAQIGKRVLRPVDWLTQKAERVATSGGAAELVQEGPEVHVREFERLRAAVLQAHVVLRERTSALAAGEARLRAVVDTAADAIVVTDERGTVLSFNRAAEAIFGYAASEAVLGLNVTALLNASRGTEADVRHAAFWLTSTTNGCGVGREVEGLRMDGTAVPLELSIAEWRDVRGARHFTLIMRDISSRRAAEARQFILMREVDHRAKNILAVVQSVLRLTPQDQPGAFAAARTRVDALARAHSLLAEGGWSGADLRVLAERELAPFVKTLGDQKTFVVSLDGPLIALAPSAVQPLAMVLHELATNAAKHGALSLPGGRVEVRWSANRRAGEDGLLRLVWTEVGGPPIVGAARRKGFGTRVVEATVRGQLGGSIERRWEPTGIVVEVVVPVSRVLAGAEAADYGAAGPIAAATKKVGVLQYGLK
jgi:PAS domain S-box-containing protein